MQHGRAAAAGQRHPRRHGSGRAAARAALGGGADEARSPRTLRGPAGHDRPLAGQRPKLPLDDRGARARPGVRPDPVSPGGHQDPHANRARGADLPGRGVTSRDRNPTSGALNGGGAAGPVALGTAGDSFAVAAWTLVSRCTGVLRVLAVGAVLGPTLLGNTFQLTNSLPNLVFYGFLAGSLFSSLLVPTLGRALAAGDRRASERIVGGFLGVALLVLTVRAAVA